MFFPFKKMKLVEVSLEYSEGLLSACCICIVFVFVFVFVSQMAIESNVKYYGPQAMSWDGWWGSFLEELLGDKLLYMSSRKELVYSI